MRARGTFRIVPPINITRGDVEDNMAISGETFANTAETTPPPAS